MAKRTFHCSVVTPERTALEADAEFVALPAHDGEVGILPDRAPLVCRLGIGELRVRDDTGTHHFFIDEGFAQVLHNQVTLLTEQAIEAEKIDVNQARAALDKARAMEVTDDQSYIERQKAIARAKAQLDLATGS